MPLTSRERSQRYRERHPERVKANRRRRYTDNKGHENARNNEWRRNNKDKIHNAHLLLKYGISLEQYEAMLRAQEGKCLICQEATSGRLDTDHDHSTNKVRGLLCRKCNTGLGQFEHNVDRLAAAIGYLIFHQEDATV